MRDIIYQQMNIHLQYTVEAHLDSVFLGSARTFSTLEKTKKQWPLHPFVPYRKSILAEYALQKLDLLSNTNFFNITSSSMYRPYTSKFKLVCTVTNMCSGETNIECLVLYSMKISSSKL